MVGGWAWFERIPPPPRYKLDIKIQLIYSVATRLVLLFSETLQYQQRGIGVLDLKSQQQLNLKIQQIPYLESARMPCFLGLIEKMQYKIVCMYVYQGGVIFWLLVMLCKFVMTQIPIFLLEMLVFNLSQGLALPQKIFTVTIKSAQK